MSLQSFQRALSELIASPDLIRATRSDPSQTLRRYDLSERERRRLIAVAGQDGMSVNCALYRANRITPLCSILPLTCFVLGDALKGEVDALCKSYERAELQFKTAIDQFAGILRARIKNGEIENPFLEEVLGFELAVSYLRFLARKAVLKEMGARTFPVGRSALQLHPCIQLVQFRHDPMALLPLVMGFSPPPYRIAKGEFYLVLDGMNAQLEFRSVEQHLGRLLQMVHRGLSSSLRGEEAEYLIETGFVIEKQS